MASSLATIRTNIANALPTGTAQIYRRRQTNPQFPCYVVGWPEEYDFRPTHGGEERDATVPVWIGVQSSDDDSADDLLSALMDAAASNLQTSVYDVRPASSFSEQLLDDGRIIIWCALPVAVLA